MGLVSCLREKKRGIPVETLSEAEEEWNDPSSGIIEEENFKALHDQIEDTLTDYENAVWWSYMSGMTAKEIGETVRNRQRNRRKRNLPDPEETA